MNALINFFTVRPVFTFQGIRIVWYLYLFHLAIQTYFSLAEVSAVMARSGVDWQTWWPRTLPLIFGVAAQIGLVRLLIEVAASIILTPRRPEN
jgi:hypothetical protein